MTSSARNLSRALDNDIAIAHGRFVSAMERRIPTLELDTKERYFVVLSTLVTKLETPDKNWRDVLHEMIGEAAGHLFDEMGATRK